MTYDRPPEGLARGRWAAPSWAVVALGAAILLCAIVYLVLRARRALRGGRLPPSGRGAAGPGA